MSGKLYLIAMVLVVFGYCQAMDLKRLLEGKARSMRSRRALPNPIHNHNIDTRGQVQPTCNSDNAGEIWYEGCNTCGCPLRRGVEPVCARRACRSPIQKRDLRSQLEEASTLMCPGGRVPGETYRDGCNRCHCSEGGMEFCTVKNCDLGVSYETSSSSGEVTHEVIDVKAIKLTNLLCREHGLAGHKFTDGCHICYCSHHGLMCSTNYCPKLPASYWERKFRSDRRREQEIEEERVRYDY
ncbi:uncharacterized protein LOC135483172 [Lineus longissimus]|uniref:uncharacterized protein LOC135483172 n=1 Tax=Lineus longissimus TaxID=88925 RepID=UPI00315D082F